MATAPVELPPQPPVRPSDMDPKYRGKNGQAMFKKDMAKFDTDMRVYLKKKSDWDLKQKQQAELDAIQKRVEAQRVASGEAPPRAVQPKKGPTIFDPNTGEAIVLPPQAPRGYSGFPAQTVALLQGMQNMANPARTTPRTNEQLANQAIAQELMNNSVDRRYKGNLEQESAQRTKYIADNEVNWERERQKAFAEALKNEMTSQPKTYPLRSQPTEEEMLARYAQTPQMSEAEMLARYAPKNQMTEEELLRKYAPMDQYYAAELGR